MLSTSWHLYAYKSRQLRPANCSAKQRTFTWQHHHEMFRSFSSSDMPVPISSHHSNASAFQAASVNAYILACWQATSCCIFQDQVPVALLLASHILFLLTVRAPVFCCATMSPLQKAAAGEGILRPAPLLVRYERVVARRRLACSFKLRNSVRVKRLPIRYFF